MKQFLGIGNETPKQLLEMLQSNADNTGEETFVNPYTEVELEKQQKKYVSGQKEFKKLTNKLNKIKKEYQGLLKPLKESNDALLTNLELGGEMVKEEVFYFTDHEEKKVGTYNAKGVLISERPAQPAELHQTANVFQMQPAADERFVNPNQFIEPAAKTGTEDPAEDFRFIDKKGDYNDPDDRPF